jgi:hypothetical protein
VGDDGRNEILRTDGVANLPGSLRVLALRVEVRDGAGVGEPVRF